MWHICKLQIKGTGCHTGSFHGPDQMNKQCDRAGNGK